MQSEDRQTKILLLREFVDEMISRRQMQMNKIESEIQVLKGDREQISVSKILWLVSSVRFWPAKDKFHLFISKLNGYRQPGRDLTRGARFDTCKKKVYVGIVQ